MTRGTSRQHHAAESHETTPTGVRRPAVLDIGGDTGALILYTPPDLLGAEIEVSPVDEPTRRTHTQVLRRVANGREVYAALYAELPAGHYTVWDDVPRREHKVTVTGGLVSKLDWR